MNRQPSANDSRRRLDVLLLSYYIRYDVLQQLMAQIPWPPETTIVDIYIDLYDIFHNFFGDDYVINLRDVMGILETKYAITSYIINAAAHYRGFFRNYLRLNTRIHMVYGAEINGNQKRYWPSFGDKIEKKMYNFDYIQLQINEQLSMINTLTTYINEVYYVYTKSSFPIWSYLNIRRTQAVNPNCVSLLITGNKYNYQVPAMDLGHHTYILRPLKWSGEDHSIIVKPVSSLLQYYSKLKPTATAYRLLAYFHPSLMSLLMALNGCISKNVYSFVNINRAVIAIYNSISNSQMVNNYYSDLPYVYNILRAYRINDLISEVDFEKRFQALDLEYQYQMFAAQYDAKDMSWKKNLSDPETMIHINNHEFSKTPLDLMNL